MLFKSRKNIKYIFATIKSSFLPAFLFLLCLLTFYSSNPYSEGIPYFLHYTFLVISSLTLGLLYVANQAKPLFGLLIGIVSYMIINNLKAQYGANFFSQAEFQCLCFFLPVNFFILSFLPQSKLKTLHNAYLLLALLFEAVILQHFCEYIKLIPHIDITIETVPLWSCFLWLTLLTALVIFISFNNATINTGQFYAAAGLFLGLIYASTSSGLTTFFLGFSTILLCSSVLDMYRRYNFDYLEHVGSKNSYLAHANSKFPFKYTIALFSLDNRDKIKQIVGDVKMGHLEQMIINSILEMPYELTLYRYSESEIIMVFKNEDAKHAKEFADNIRHNIAASEFVLSNNIGYKITVSVCVSEKTRKDRNAEEVTERAHLALQKSYHFNGNVTTIA